MKMFSYTHGTEEFNDLVDEVVAFAAAEINKENLDNRDERIKNLNYGIAKYCTADTKVASIFEAKGLDAMKDPKVQKNRDVQENFDNVISQIINPILPMVTNQDFQAFLADVHQVGYGDTARFIVHSNELYKVNEIAEGVTRGVMQPIHDTEYTLQASPIQIAAELDFYAVAAGIYDWGNFGVRVARSFEYYIYKKVIAALTSAVTNDLSAAYTTTGFTNTNWSTLAQRVSAANGGSAVFAIGTLVALNNVIPSQAGLQYGLGQKIADQGYLDQYFGTRLICLDQAIGYNTVNTTADFELADNAIYFLPVGGYKPVHIVYEGDSVTVERSPEKTPDQTYRVAITYRVGVGAIVGSKFAKLNLN